MSIYYTKNLFLQTSIESVLFVYICYTFKNKQDFFSELHDISFYFSIITAAHELHDIGQLETTLRH